MRSYALALLLASSACLAAALPSNFRGLAPRSLKRPGVPLELSHPLIASKADAAQCGCFDLIILLDSGKSLGLSPWQVVQSYLASTFIYQFQPYDSQHVRIALIDFNSQKRHFFNFGTPDIATLSADIAKMTYASDSSEWRIGFDATLNLLDSGARPDYVATSVVFFSDGQNDGDFPTDIIAQIHNNHKYTRLLCVGVPGTTENLGPAQQQALNKVCCGGDGTAACPNTLVLPSAAALNDPSTTSKLVALSDCNRFPGACQPITTPGAGASSTTTTTTTTTTPKETTRASSGNDCHCNAVLLLVDSGTTLSTAVWTILRNDIASNFTYDSSIFGSPPKSHAHLAYIEFNAGVLNTLDFSTAASDFSADIQATPFSSGESDWHVGFTAAQNLIDKEIPPGWPVTIVFFTPGRDSGGTPITDIVNYMKSKYTQFRLVEVLISTSASSFPPSIPQANNVIKATAEGICIGSTQGLKCPATRAKFPGAIQCTRGPYNCP